MTVAEQKIEIAIVVVVEEFQSPSAHQARGRTNARRKGEVAKGLVLVVVIERVHLVIDVGLEQINPAVLIVVSRIDSHPGTWFAENIHPNSRQQTYFFKSSF